MGINKIVSVVSGDVTVLKFGGGGSFTSKLHLTGGFGPSARKYRQEPSGTPGRSASGDHARSPIRQSRSSRHRESRTWPEWSYIWPGDEGLRRVLPPTLEPDQLILVRLRISSNNACLSTRSDSNAGSILFFRPIPFLLSQTN